MPRRTLPLQFPTGGLDRRLTYQKQPPYTTPPESNVMDIGLFDKTLLRTAAPATPASTNRGLISP